MSAGETRQCEMCGHSALLERDHDHRNGLCRGWVCHSCNLLIGRYDRPLSDIWKILGYLHFWADVHTRIGGEAYIDFMRVTSPKFRRQG